MSADSRRRCDDSSAAQQRFLSLFLRSEREIFRYVDVASAVLPIMAGADFVMSGPIEYARRVFHAASFADRMLEQAAGEL